MPNALRRLPTPAEMNAFDAEVGRDQRLVVSRNAQDRAVIPNPQDSICPAYRASKLLEELSFRKRHEKRLQGTGDREQGMLSARAKFRRA